MSLLARWAMLAKSVASDDLCACLPVRPSAASSTPAARSRRSRQEWRRTASRTPPRPRAPRRNTPPNPVARAGVAVGTAPVGGPPRPARRQRAPRRPRRSPGRRCPRSARPSRRPGAGTSPRRTCRRCGRPNALGLPAPLSPSRCAHPPPGALWPTWPPSSHLSASGSICPVKADDADPREGDAGLGPHGRHRFDVGFAMTAGPGGAVAPSAQRHGAPSAPCTKHTGLCLEGDRPRRCTGGRGGGRP